MRLHSYWRSSAAYRVRIALHWKGIAFETLPHHLARAEQRAPEYLAQNPQGLVPTLDDDGFVLGQSLAIIEYLEQTHPEPPLLPADPQTRAVARAMAHNPEMILYDEPTTGLDPIIGSTICDLIVKLRDLEGVTSVLVTHQLRDAFQVAQSFVMRRNGDFVYNRIDDIERLVGTDFLVLNQGQIVFQGRQRDLFRSDVPYVRQFLEGQIPAFGR